MALSEPCRVAIAQFFHGIDARLAQQPGIFPAHAPDAQLVGDVGPAQQPPLVQPGLCGEELASLRTFRRSSSFSVVRMPTDLSASASSAIDIFDRGNRVGHLVPSLPAGRRRYRRRTNPWAAEGCADVCRPPCLPAFSRAGRMFQAREPVREPCAGGPPPFDAPTTVRPAIAHRHGGTISSLPRRCHTDCMPDGWAGPARFSFGRGVGRNRTMTAAGLARGPSGRRLYRRRDAR